MITMGITKGITIHIWYDFPQSFNSLAHTQIHWVLMGWPFEQWQYKRHFWRLMDSNLCTYKAQYTRQLLIVFNKLTQHKHAMIYLNSRQKKVSSMACILCFQKLLLLFIFFVVPGIKPRDLPGKENALETERLLSSDLRNCSFCLLLCSCYTQWRLGLLPDCAQSSLLAVLG